MESKADMCSMKIFNFRSSQCSLQELDAGAARGLLFLHSKNNSKFCLARRRRILAGAKYVKNIEDQF